DAWLTYGELDEKARAIAASLAQSVGPGERVLLLYPPGLEYIAAFFGCLYANVIAVPAYPPDPARLERMLPRLLAILSDAQAAVVLTSDALLTLIEPVLPELGGVSVLSSTGCAKADAWRAPDVGPETIAFLQYTSGSTAAPKGVKLTHGNLLHNAEAI